MERGKVRLRDIFFSDNRQISMEDKMMMVHDNEKGFFKLPKQIFVSLSVSILKQ